MSINNHQLRTWADKDKIRIQSSSVQRSSIHSTLHINNKSQLSEIQTFKSRIGSKLTDSIRFFFENINGLPMNNIAWKTTHKYK